MQKLGHPDSREALGKLPTGHVRPTNVRQRLREILGDSSDWGSRWESEVRKKQGGGCRVAVPNTSGICFEARVFTVEELDPVTMGIRVRRSETVRVRHRGDLWICGYVDLWICGSSNTRSPASSKTQSNLHGAATVRSLEATGAVS